MAEGAGMMANGYTLVIGEEPAALAGAEALPHPFRGGGHQAQAAG
jgi:hypothetical protein